MWSPSSIEPIVQSGVANKRRQWHRCTWRPSIYLCQRRNYIPTDRHLRMVNNFIVVINEVWYCIRIKFRNVIFANKPKLCITLCGITCWCYCSTWLFVSMCNHHDIAYLGDFCWTYSYRRTLGGEGTPIYLTSVRCCALRIGVSEVVVNIGDWIVFSRYSVSLSWEC